MTYVVHWDYSKDFSLIRCPGGNGILLKKDKVRSFLFGRKWRYAV